MQNILELSLLIKVSVHLIQCVMKWIRNLDMEKKLSDTI